jgi:hypothetical protein
MTYHSFDRQILCKTETTEGTAIAVAAADYIDTTADIDLSFEPVMNERDLVRPGHTKVPDLFSSTGLTSGTMVGTGTMTFTVEMSMKSGSTPTATAPQWAPLLKACGFEEITGVKRIGMGAISTGPMFNREQVEVSAASKALAVGTHFNGDSYFYHTEVSGGLSASDACTGRASGGTFTTSGASAAVGIAYLLDTDTSSGDGSSCTIQLYRAGKLVTFKGCRGSVAFEFASTNRVLMTFTMQGVLHTVATGAKVPTIAIGHALPSTFDDATLKVAEHASSTMFTSAFFDSLSLDLGNEITIRSNANSTAGFKSGQIVGRAPTMTMNPDAVLGGTTSATVFDFYANWVTGASVRAEWKVGAGMDAQSALFRAPALVIEGVSPGDRDEVEVDEISAKLTGGFYGDSVDKATPTTYYHDDRGYDNEISIILF